MSKKTVVLAMLTSIVLVAVGVGIHAVINRLSDRAVYVLVGGVLILLVVFAVGVLFVVKDLAQAYIMRRMLAQDDLNDLRQMAMMARLMGGTRTPNVNLRLPSGQTQPWSVAVPQQQLPQGQVVDFDGSFRDTIVDSEVEIE
jgi:hypothetical protein